MVDAVTRRSCLVLALAASLACVGGGAKTEEVTMEEYLKEEAKLDELREAYFEQERLLEHLEKGEICDQSDMECIRPHLSASQKIKRQQADRLRLLKEQEPIPDRFKMVSTLVAPSGAEIIVVKFLPFSESNGTKQMNKYLVGADSKGFLHIFTSDGETLMSQETGHAGAITALAVDQRQSTEYKIATGSKDGEIRLFTLAAPTRRKAGGRRKDGEVGPVGPAEPWEAHAELGASWFPARIDAVKGLSGRHHQLDLSEGGPQPITALEFVAKGRSFNVLAGDSVGRVTVHIRNGSTTGSVQLPAGGPVRCAVGFNSMAALCTPQGVALYETKERRLLNHQCSTLALRDEALPDPDPAPKPGPAPPRPHPTDTDTDTVQTHAQSHPRAAGAGAGAGGGQGGSGKKKANSIPLNASVVSLAADQTSQTGFFAGTAHGTLLVLQIRGERSRVRCTVQHELPVVRADGGQAGEVSVATTKGFVVAAAAGGGGTGQVGVYNLSASSRANPPELLLFAPLDLATPSTKLEVSSDRQQGVVLCGGGGGARVVEARLPYLPPSEWNLSWMSMLRHPLLLGGVGMMFTWQMRKKKAPGPDAPPDFDVAEALRGMPGGLAGLQGAAGGALGGMPGMGMGGMGGMGGGGYGGGGGFGGGMAGAGFGGGGGGVGGGFGGGGRSGNGRGF